MHRPVDQGPGGDHPSDAKLIKAGFGERLYPAAKLVAVIEALADEGISPADILRRAQIAPEELHSPATRVSLNQLVAGLLGVVELSRNALLAYRIGASTHISARGMYGYALLCCTDFRRTMEFAVKYHQLAAPVATISFSEKDQSGFWTIEPVQHPKMTAQLYRFVTEMQIGTHISLHRDVMGASFLPREVRVTYNSRDSGLRPDLVGCPVLFEQPTNQIMFDATTLDRSPTLGNRATFASVTELCDELLADMKLRTGLTGKIRELLLQDISNRPTFVSIASKLGMSGRTVRRQLQQQQFSFRELVDELRLHLALKYLQETEMTNEDIAFALGFSDAANFRHAFRRWTRKAPREFRRRMDPSHGTQDAG